MSKYLIYALLIGIAFLIVIIVVLNLTSKKESPGTPLTTPPPSTVPISTGGGQTNNQPQQNKEYQILKDEEKTQLEKDAAVADLIEKLPHQGQNFSLSYDFSTNQFLLTIKSSDQTKASEEFDAYLKENKIQSRSWLKNLVVK